MDIEPSAETAVPSHIVKAGTGKSNPVIDRILRERLSDEQAAVLAQIAATNISEGRIGYDAQEQMPFDQLAAIQHDMGVHPALTGAVDLGDGATLFTRKVPNSKTVGIVSRNELTHQDRDGIAKIEKDRGRGIA